MQLYAASLPSQTVENRVQASLQNYGLGAAIPGNELVFETALCAGIPLPFRSRIFDIWSSLFTNKLAKLMVSRQTTTETLTNSCSAPVTVLAYKCRYLRDIPSNGFNYPDPTDDFNSFQLFTWRGANDTTSVSYIGTSPVEVLLNLDAVVNVSDSGPYLQNQGTEALAFRLGLAVPTDGAFGGVANRRDFSLARVRLAKRYVKISKPIVKTLRPGRSVSFHQRLGPRVYDMQTASMCRDNPTLVDGGSNINPNPDGTYTTNGANTRGGNDPRYDGTTDSVGATYSALKGDTLWFYRVQSAAVSTALLYDQVTPYAPLSLGTGPGPIFVAVSYKYAISYKFVEDLGNTPGTELSSYYFDTGGLGGGEGVPIGTNYPVWPRVTTGATAATLTTIPSIYSTYW